MADIISRLRLESGEFDSKIKRAGQELMAYSEHCRKTGLVMGFANKDARDFAQSLGSMQTTSTTARGKINELSDAFVNLRVMYMNMTDEEKNNQFGKNLAASLDQLKTRIQEAKTQLDTATQSLNDNGEAGKGTSGIMEVLKDKFTVNIDAIKLFNIGLQAAEGALSVAKDAFFASEATVDEWGRVVDSSKSLYQGFLTALNTGDISGYLGRIDEIVTAARRAYDELDRLGTMKTIQAPKMSAQQTENERMRMMIQTGRYIAPVDGRRASMKDGQLLTPEQIRRIEAQLQNGMKAVVTLVGNEVKQTGKAIDAVYDRQAKELGLSLSEFRKGTSSMAEFDKRMAGYDQYQKWREQHTTIDMKSGREIVARGNPFEQFAKWGTFRVDGERYNDLVRLIQQRDQQAGQAYSMQSQAYRTINRAEGITVSKLMRGETTGGGKGGKGTTKTPQTELQQNQTKINELTQQYVTLMAAASKAGKPLTDEQQKQTAEIQRHISELEKRNGQLKLYQEQAQGKLLGPDAFRQQLSVDVAVNNKKIEELEKQLLSLDGITIDPKTVTITATDEALPKLREIQGITIDDKTMTVTADTMEALRAVQGINGVTINPKTVTITATDDALPKLREIQGITIDDKTMTVTAQTADALRALQGIDGVTIDPKTVTITATDEALPKLREIDGITIDDKTMTVTAETADALRALQGIEGVTINPKTVTITATDEALPKLREIDGITIDDKTMTVTADTQEALQALQAVDGVTIDTKNVKVTAETDEARQKVEKLKRQIAELKDQNIQITAAMSSIGMPLSETPRMGVTDVAYGKGKNQFVPAPLMPSMDDVVRQRGGNLLDEKAMKAVNEDIGRNLPKDNETDKRDDPLKEAKKQNQYLEGIGSDISGMLSGLEKMGIEIPEGLSSVVGGIQMISGIVSSILTLVGVISALTSVKSVPIFGWLLAQGGIAGGLGGRHPIHAAGGTVVGNTYSGDQIPAMLNAGEVVLNRAQQGNIASQLENGASQNLKLDAVISGEQIRMVLNNNGRRTGRGEYVTSNRR